MNNYPLFLVRNLIYSLSILSNLGLGFFVFLKGRKEKINRTFFACMLAAAGWLFSLFLYFTIDSPQVVLWMGRFNFAIIFALLYFLFRFAVIFPRVTIAVSRKLERVLPWWFLFCAIVTFFTPLVGEKEIITGPGQRETVYGPLLPLYSLHFVFFSILIVALLFHKTKACLTKTERMQAKYVVIGLSLALIFGFVTTIVLSQFGLFEASNFAPLATVIFSGFVTTAIFRYHLFGIKVILVEILVVMIALILFIQILVAEPRWVKVLNFGVFILFCVFGYFLIKATIREVKMRERAERLAKREMETRKEVEKLSRAKTEFIAMASHQLRTPLTIIKGLISMILEGSYNHTPEKLKRPLKNVFNSNERLIKIVDDLLKISKVELGKMELEEEEVQIEELIESIYQETKGEAQKKQLKLIWNKPKTPLPKIKIDKVKIRQVILNLVDNAIKYTQKGEVEIKVRKVNSNIQVSVRDTGAGLTKEEKERIFEAFVRGEAGISRWIQGAGLGLYLAKKYIELHRGKIWAESPGRGKGSIFYVELPIK